MPESEPLNVVNQMLNDVAAANIVNYSKKLGAGLRGLSFSGAKVKIGECIHFLKLWVSMAEKGMNIDALTDLEKQELKEAIVDSIEVHILSGGSTLCGKYWPDYQKENLTALWVGLAMEKQHFFVNCQGCLLAKKLVPK